MPSFGRAGELFTGFTCTPISEATVRRYVERAGQVLLKLDPPPAAALRGLDFWHVAEHVHTFSRVLWAQSEGNQHWWAGEILHDLKHHGPGRLLRSLAGWEATGGRTPTGTVARERRWTTFARGKSSWIIRNSKRRAGR